MEYGGERAAFGEKLSSKTITNFHMNSRYNNQIVELVIWVIYPAKDKACKDLTSDDIRGQSMMFRAEDLNGRDAASLLRNMLKVMGNNEELGIITAELGSLGWVMQRGLRISLAPRKINRLQMMCLKPQRLEKRRQGDISAESALKPMFEKHIRIEDILYPIVVKNVLSHEVSLSLGITSIQDGAGWGGMGAGVCVGDVMMVEMLKELPRLWRFFFAAHPWVREGGDALEIPLDISVLCHMREFVKYSRLKQFALRALASTLGPEELSDLRDQFDAIDIDKSGSISLEEIRQALAKDQPWTLKESRVLEILQAMDSNRDGLVDFDEFVAATLHVHQLEEHDSEKWQQRSRAAFEKFDFDRDGYITPEELRM
ncbi:hypothetical protein KI387_013137, partial [Taxus chinensis]